jgi:hypothetical protein
MSEIWVPEYDPPQVSAEAQQAVSMVLLDGDVPTITNSLEEEVLKVNEPLDEYIDQLGSEMCMAKNNLMPLPVLRFSTVLALQAYRESGFDQIIDEEAWEVGTFTAGWEGIPTTYLISLVQDPGLQAVVDLAAVKLETSRIEPANLGRGYRYIMEIGAGCARHYLKSALEAA